MWASGQYGYPSDYLLWWIVPFSLGLHLCCFFRLIHGRPRRIWYLIVGNTLMVLLMLAVVGLVAESYLRFVSVETDTFGATLTSKRWFKVFPKLNSSMYRDDEWAEVKPPGVRRIAFVGDSFTYGWGINDRADRFTDRLQRMFDEKSDEKVQVMNAAWVGSDTELQARLISEMVGHFGVDEVVLCYLANDIENLIPKPDGENPLRREKSRIVNTDSSFLLDYLYYRIVVPRQMRIDYFAWLQRGYETPAIWQRQLEQFDAIITYLRAQGVKLRVVLLPFVRTPDGSFDAASVHRQVAEAFQTRGVEVLDLLGVFQGHDPRTLIVNSHDMHPNEEAHKLIADAIWQGLYQSPRTR